MTHLLGIDLGTSSVKVLLIDLAGRTIAVAAHEYPIETPHPGHAEQSPAAWWAAVVAAVRAVLAQAGKVDIQAIGLCGQMHGFALVDSAAQPIAPAIIWPDQRTTAEVAIMQERIGAERLAYLAGTLPATGFMGPTMLWLQKHQPSVLEKAAAALLPKDMIRAYLTGEIATDASDASASGIFDIHQRTWSDEIVNTLGLPGHLLPRVLESTDIAGYLTPAAAEILGLPAGIPVAAGSADQAAQAVGNGLIDPGFGSVTLGTGGQVFIPLTQPQTDIHLHTFCHAAPDRWYMMGAMLSAGMSLRWLRDMLGLREMPEAYTLLSDEAAEVPPGADGLLFLPYLVGERSPLMDSQASGVFVGLSLHHNRAHLARAIMEGVAFALRHILDVMTAQNVAVEGFLAAGNGLNSPIWRQITADILARPLRLSSSGEHTALGAALIAGIGAGIYPDFAALRTITTRPTTTTEPDTAHEAVYRQQYALFLQAYPALQGIMHGLKP